MRNRYTRLSVALLVPPIAGSFLAHAIGLLVQVGSGGKFKTVGDLVLSLAIFAAYGFIFCLLPGLGVWITTEIIVRRQLHRGLHIGACVLFGAIAGIGIPLSVGGLDSSMMALWLTVGVIVGVGTSLLLQRLNTEAKK